MSPRWCAVGGDGETERDARDHRGRREGGGGGRESGRASDVGVEVPEVIAVERTGVAANRRAGGGWTDGRQRLGTSPEKDVGFPYRSTLVPGRNTEVDEQMMRFSWQSYLVASDQFVGWIDRGRPAPTHDTWARYLRWVADVVGLKVVRGEVVQISRRRHLAGCWTLTSRA